MTHDINKKKMREDNTQLNVTYLVERRACVAEDDDAVDDDVVVAADMVAGIAVDDMTRRAQALSLLKHKK